MNAARFLLGYIARQPQVTTGEALALAATDPVLPVGVRALAAETALDARGTVPVNGDAA